MEDPLLTTIYQNDDNLLDSVKVLLDQGNDPNKITEYGESPLRVASNNGRFDVVDLLLKSGADAAQLGWSELHRATALGTLGDVENLLNQKSDLVARDFWSRTPWLLSLQVGDIKKADSLLAAGSDPDAVGRCGKIPMAYAIENDRVELLSWLIGKGFDIEAADEFDETAVHVAAEFGKTTCLKVLIDAGADLSRENHTREKAIAKTEDPEIIALLAASGEDLNDLSAEGRAKLLGLALDQDPICSKEDYAAGKDREFGRANPELTEKPFWTAMVKCGASAFRARRRRLCRSIRAG